MTTDLATIGSHNVLITAEQTELIKRTICQGATDAEMQLFFFDCQRRGVHPLDKLIHFTKRSGKYTPITSIDFMRQRAESSGVFAGEDEPLYTYLSSGAVDTCTYSVYRLVQGQRYKWSATARWDEYYPGDQLGFMWKKMPTLMLAKCAEALALRKAFPSQLQGLYVNEEMDQAGRQKVYSHERLEGGKDCVKQEQPAVEDGADTAERASVVATPAPSDAPPPSPDPAEAYRIKLRVCERTPQAIVQTYNAIPPELQQDCHTELQVQLRSVEKKGKKA